MKVHLSFRFAFILFANRMTFLSFPPFVLISKAVMTAVSPNYEGKGKEGNDKLAKMELYVKV